MSTSAVVIERFTHVAPFGLGLWDMVTGRLVGDDMIVRVHSLAGTQSTGVVVALPNRRGLFTAHGFERLRRFEAGLVGVDPWITDSPPRSYLVEVRDTAGRFIPFAMHVALPAMGLVMPACVPDLWPAEPSSPVGSTSSPPSAPLVPSYVPLFSAPTRAVPAGQAAVRASLIDHVTGRPAAWAVLELSHAGDPVARGIADERGEVLALFPYPEPPAPPSTSPGGGATVPRPLATQSWPLEVTVRHGAVARYPVGDPNALPDLCELLRQPLATVQTSSPLAPLTEAPLMYGEELVLGANAGVELFISPA